LFIDRWFFWKRCKRKRCFVVSTYLGKDEFIIGQILKERNFILIKRINLKIFDLDNSKIFQKKLSNF
jgi:hypothetical protein